MMGSSELKIVIVSVAIVLFGGIVITALFMYNSSRVRTSVAMPTNTLKGWLWYQTETKDSSGGVVIENDALKCDCIVSNGKQDSLILTQHRFIPEDGHKYHVTFSAKANPPRQMRVWADQGGWATLSDNIGLEKMFDIGMGWTKYDATFTAVGKLGHAVALPAFGLGGSVGTVWIRDVSVEEVK